MIRGPRGPKALLSNARVDRSVGIGENGDVLYRQLPIMRENRPHA